MDDHKFKSSYSNDANAVEYVYESQFVRLNYKIVSSYVNTYYREGERFYDVNVDPMPVISNGQFYSMLRSAIITIFEKELLG